METLPGPSCSVQGPELEPGAVELRTGSMTASSEPLDAAAAPIAEPQDLQMHPILEQWECNSDGSITGRVYGKLGWEEGITMTTSIVPTETHYATYVITVSGSIYRLGEKLSGVGQTDTRNADAQLLIPATLPAASAQPRSSGRAKCAPLEFWKGERPIYAASPNGLTLQGVIRYPCSDAAALPASTQKARGASRPAQRGSSPGKTSEKEAASICASKDDSQRAAASAAAATAAARAREEAARAATTAAEARAATAEAKARAARAELEATRARAAEAAAAAAAAAAAMDAAQREAAAAATATEEARREVEAAQREAAAALPVLPVLPPKPGRPRAPTKPLVVVAPIDIDRDSPVAMDSSQSPISPLAAAGELLAGSVAKAQAEAERVWSALGAGLCGWAGCTKPARHSGFCVSVPDSRREKEPVQMDTAKPAPSPRELMSHARNEGRLPPSKKPKLGDRVRGKYQGQIGGRNWFDGVVTAVHEDGTCDLQYDDGDYEERVAPRFIKVIAEAETEEREEEEESEVEEEEVVEEPSEGQGTDGANLGAASVSKQPRERKALHEGGSHRPRIKPEEVRAVAAAEGLELLPSSRNETGFRDVTKRKGKYHADIRETDVHRNIRGTFATREEAALGYARHIGAERAAAEAAEGRAECPQPLTADEARAAAAAARAAAVAEGLKLVPSLSNETGFKGVTKREKSYEARKKENGKQRRLGSFATAEEAALCYARYIGAERAAAEAAEARVEGPQPLTADEARAAAAAEGLELVPSSIRKTGFKYVHALPGGKFEASVWDHDKTIHLGTFATAEEAALCYARYVGVERAAAEAAEARVAAPQPLTADEARAAAAAEGLELVPSSRSRSVTGFKGVRMHTPSYFQCSVIEENGEKKRYLGTFRTPEEAALCYARHIGAERAAAEAAKVRGECLQLKADEARAAAAAEGLELVPSLSSETGFKGVYKHHRKYKAYVSENGNGCHLGTFATAEEAALCHARYIGAERAAAEAAEARVEVPQPLTADEARAAAAAEGLELVPSLSNETGFKGVTKRDGKYATRIRENGKQHYRGTFATAEEAALCYARYIGVERAAAEAAEARVAARQPLTADEARAAAAAEGLELVPSSRSRSVAGFKYVQMDSPSHFSVRVTEENGEKKRYPGTFRTPEEAALCYARHIGAERAAAEAAEARVVAPQPHTTDERARAAAEGLEPAEAHLGWCVLHSALPDDRRKLQDSPSSSAPPPTSTPSATEHASRKRLAAAVACAEVVLQGSVDKARAAAAAEGLELVPSLSNETGFKGVSKSYGRYDARIRENGKQRHLGIFATAEEAALCYARHIGAERAAEEAAEATKKPLPLTADEARAAAAAEGLELVQSSSNETGFKGVVKHYGKYATRIRVNHHHSSLGTFATPEEASLTLARYVRDLVDGWLIPGRRPPHHPPRQAPVPAPPTPTQVERAEALRCWRLLLIAMRDDRRKQQDSPSSSAPPPPPSPAGATGHASRKRPAAAVACAEVDSQRAMTLQAQLTAERSDDPRAAHCIICLEALDLRAASASSRGEAACGHTPCCGNYYHKRCLSQWLQGSGQSGITVSTEPKCPTCRRDLVARALIPGPYTKAIEKDMAEEEPWF